MINEVHADAIPAELEMRIVAGPGNTGFRIMNMVVNVHEPQKSYYTTHDSKDEIKKWPTFNMALSYYNQL